MCSKDELTSELPSPLRNGEGVPREPLQITHEMFLS